MLTILYRACDKELIYPLTRKERPSWFNKINCFNSLYKSILSSKYKNDINVIVFMDGDKCILSDFIEECGYTIIYNKLNSGPNSLKYQLDFSDDIDTDIYFVEDDYLHITEAIDHLYMGVKKFGLITGYDCIDRYVRTDDITKDKESIYFYNGRHWRTAESTTLTWAVSKELKSIIISNFKTYGWRDRVFFRNMFEKGIRLYQPIPGVSTHVHEPFLSPGINWEEINNMNSKKI